MIRLKGCGNLTEGFPIEKLEWPPEGTSSEVRGAQYFNSVYRELYFQSKANKILEDNGLVGANKPLGVWKYSSGDSSSEKERWTDLGLKYEFPTEIDKYCGIFETLGDKRL